MIPETGSTQMDHRQAFPVGTNYAERLPVLSGTVRLPDGQPVDSAVITVAEPGTGRQVRTARTSQSGSYQVSVPVEGTYLVIVAAPSRRPAADLVAVGASQAEHHIVLGGSGVLAGVARVAGVHETFPGVVVTLTDARGQVIATATTGPDGGYRLDGLDAGDYTLVGARAGLSPVARAVTVTGSGPVREDLEFPAPGYRLAAVVTLPGGEPFAGAVVSLSGNEGVVATSMTSDAGEVTFDEIPSGRYTMTADASGPGAVQVRVEPGRVARADLTLGAARHTAGR